MTLISLLPHPWRPLSQERMDHLSGLFEFWRGTPYMAGVQAPQQGVDCVRFVCAILDGLTGKVTPISGLPQDSAFHQRSGAEAAVRCLLRLYEPTCAVASGAPVQPGDIVIVGCSSGGPGHSLIVGTEENTLWQSDMPHGVVCGGFGLMSTYQRLHRVYRLQEIR